MKIDKFDKKKARLIAKAMEKSLKSIEAEFGVSISYCGGSFDENSFKPKFEICVIGDDGKVFDQSADDFKKYCGLYDLSPDDLGKEFVQNGRTFKITGLSMKAKKYPVLAFSKVDKKTYKFPSELVVETLKRTNSLVG